MPRPNPLVHPTAVVSPDARLADDVTVGPFAVLDGQIELGPGCVVGPHASLLGRVTAGRGNQFGVGCVIGGAPQHNGYRGEPTGVRIGDFNTFREYVTVHRAMPITGDTVVGSHNLLMVNSHVAHDCKVGDYCTFANGAVIGGHVEVGDRALLSGNTAVHQNCRVGKLALLSGTTSVSQDLPPFWIAQGLTNQIHGVNIIGMKRAGYSPADMHAVRRAYRMIHLQGWTIGVALTRIEQEFGHSEAVRELVAFIRATKRGICSRLDRALMRDEEADAPAEIKRAA
jgi:UDP-N-acetylglucosamine acyltransferase